MNQEAMRYFSGDAWVEKVGGRRSCNFPTDSSKFLTKYIIGGQQFSIKNGGFLALFFVIFGRKFSAEKKFFFERLKFSPPPCHDVTPSLNISPCLS